MPYFESPRGLRCWDQQSGELSSPQQEGYDLSLLEDCENAFRVTAVASAAKIASLIRDFSRYLPGEAFILFRVNA